MKKLLIFFPDRKIEPKGGPAGYLYNLKEGLKSINQTDIDVSFYSGTPISLEENNELRKRIPKRIKDIRRAYKYSNYLKRKINIEEYVMQYDAIHYHSTEDMYLCRDFLSSYSGKVILTSHTPCVSYKELIGRLNLLDYRLLKKKIDGLVEMDRYAFTRADCVVFPCPEAEEPYFNTWEDYANIRIKKKYRYVPTGIVGCYAKTTREEYRKKNGIDNEAFVISYVGRHNEIKGYKDLKEIGVRLLNKHNKDIYFLIAGKEGPLYRLEDKRWIEVGWTNDPHSLIAASDVFVLPNKETYFDLILLEVISLGIPAIISSTGGNKYFRQYNLPGLRLYETIDEACGILSEFKTYKRNQLEKIGNENKELFEKNFNIEVFANNYISMISSIV